MAKRVEPFDFPVGKPLSGKYQIEQRLGTGWEGEVYKIRELKTGIPRAAKFYYPERNRKGKTAIWYSQKLNLLADCEVIMQYAHRDWITFRRQRIEFLVSEYIDGQVLDRYLTQQPGGRVSPFEALHILNALCLGLEKVHRLGEYHGDIHSGNIIIKREGLGYKVKLIDVFRRTGGATENIFLDTVDLVNILYELIGGARHYRKMPTQIKDVCCGLKHTLIRKKFRNAGQLRWYLMHLQW